MKNKREEERPTGRACRYQCRYYQEQKSMSLGSFKKDHCSLPLVNLKGTTEVFHLTSPRVAFRLTSRWFLVLMTGNDGQRKGRNLRQKTEIKR
jgi:hypothetical protein